MGSKGHIRHTGIYQQGEDKDYVLLRLDTEGEIPSTLSTMNNTHALLRLNFRSCRSGSTRLAEFFGNSTLGDKEVKTGTINRALVPAQSEQADSHRNAPGSCHDSPYYNEKDRGFPLLC